MSTGTAAEITPNSDPMDDIERMLIDSARTFFRAHQQTARMKLNAEHPKAFDPELWREIAEMGWLGLRLPEALGGQDLDIGAAAALAEQFGAAMMPEPFIACSLIPTVLLANCPDSPARSALAESICSGTELTTLAWQEHIGQSEPAAITTRLSATGHLQGRKLFVPNADSSSLFLVTARTDSELVLASVRASAPGLQCELETTGDGSRRAQASFVDPTIEAIVATGATAETALGLALDEATLASAAYQTGLANTVLEQVLAHLKTRIQFERPLGTFQTLQHRSADLYMACQLSRASWRRAAAKWRAHPGSSGAKAAISAAKARASQTSLRVARSAIQMFGGLGFAEEAEAGLALRIALQHSSWLGGPALHLQRFATLTGLRT